jgi:hypothetical protein
MEKLLKKGHHSVLSQLFSLYVQTSITFVPVDLRKVINNYSKVFEEIHEGLPTTRYHDHVIHLQPGTIPPNIRPYISICTKE